MRVAQPAAPHRGRGRADGPNRVPVSFEAGSWHRPGDRAGRTVHVPGTGRLRVHPSSARPCSGVVSGEHVRVWHNE